MITFPDTIFALSSGALPSGVAVIRISGRQAGPALRSLMGQLPEARKAVYGRFRTETGEQLDSGIALYLPGPGSFTGEDVCELHIHGGHACVAALLQEIGRRPGFRMAEAGEFTRRAFLNGRMDLTQVEGFADLLASETEAQRKLALASAEGRLRNLYEGWRRQLIRARAMIEAELDFSEEDDVPGSVSDIARAEVESLAASMKEHVRGFHRAEIVRNGFDVVIVGKPNVGKSSLMNALAKRDVAIVSDEAGTTRDLIEIALDVDGLKIRLTDTAGLRDAASAVEQIGVGRARQRAETADLVLLLSEGTGGKPELPGIDESRIMRIDSKTDIHARREGRLGVSTVTGAGLDELVEQLGGKARRAVGSVAGVAAGRERQQFLLTDAASAIEAALATWNAPEMAGEELRIASERLSSITGGIGVEDLLDVIFREFCIGK